MVGMNVNSASVVFLAAFYGVAVKHSPISQTRDGVIIDVWIVPGAAETMVTGIYGDKVKIRIAAPAEGGHANKEVTKLLVGLIGGSSVVGRRALGTLADRLGALRLFLASFVVLAASHVIWLVAGDSYVLLATYALIFGLGYGGFIALAPAVVAEVFGLEGLGGMIGTLYTAAAVGSLSGPPVAGWLIDQWGDRAAILLALVMSIAASLTLTRLSAHVGHVEASLEPAP